MCRQEDIVHSSLAVEKALWYAARLRLPPDTSESEIAHLITQVLAELDLSERRAQPIHLLSGASAKRVNIAVELLTRPQSDVPR